MSGSADQNPKGNEDGGKKKSRKRLKHICSQIRSQMEFYFSDANLSKDGFVKQMIDNAEDRYVLLETFLRFNKIRAITSEVELLSKALSSSSSLEVSSDGLKVRRKTPYTEPQDVDERTIYVECLPRSVDHDWLRQTFEEYGQVVYISLPSYRSTGDPKGFAFIEFGTIEEAEKACQALHQPGETVTGRFPKDNKQLKHMLQKQAAMKSDPESQADLTEGEHKAEAVQTNKKAKRRRRDTSESSGDEAFHTKQPRSDPGSKAEDLPTPSKQQKQSSSSSDADVSDGHTAEKKHNRKRKLDADDESTDAKKTHQETSDNNQCSDKENVQITEKKGKTKSACKAETSVSSSKVKSESKKVKLVEEPKAESSAVTGSPVVTTKEATEESEDSSSIKPRKRSNESESEAKEAKRVRINEEVQVKVGSPERKKRNRKHLKKEHIRPKEKPDLRVIPKLKWLELKSEYLAQQKSSMKELKKSLEVNRKFKHARENKKEKAKQKTMQFTPNVIVKVTCANTSSRKVITEMASLVADVAYVDMLDADTEGHIRCSDVDSAARLAAAAQKGLTYQLIQGDDEKQYWDKIIADRERKLNSKTRSKKRGTQKLLNRVEKSNLEVMQKKHVYFDD